MQQSPSTPAPARAPAAPARTAQSPAPTEASSEQALQPLYRKRGEITNQLEALKDRREELVDQAEEMPADQRSGHDARIRVIDDRSATLERELYRLDDQIARSVAAGNVVADEGTPVTSQSMTEPDFLREVRRAASNGGEDGAVSALAGTGTFLFFAFIIYKGVRRWIWKPKPAAVASGSFDAQQIAQLQRSMDVVAVEVERIAEAQRYVAKLLNERALGAGEAQPAHSRGAAKADPVERR